MVDYPQYQDLSRKNILPMLISVSEEQCKDANCIVDLEELYVLSHFTYQVSLDDQKKLYELCTDKIIEKQVRVGHFVHSDGQVSKILHVQCGNLDMNPGGFTFKTGFNNLDDLNHEIVDSIPTRQK